MWCNSQDECNASAEDDVKQFLGPCPEAALSRCLIEMQMMDAPLVQEQVEIWSVFPAGRVQAVALHYIVAEVRVHLVTSGEARQQCLDTGPVGLHGGEVVEVVGLVYLAGMWMDEPRLPVHEAPSLLMHIQRGERVPFLPATCWKHPHHLSLQLRYVVDPDRRVMSQNLFTMRYQTFLLHPGLFLSDFQLIELRRINNLNRLRDFSGLASESTRMMGR